MRNRPISRRYGISLLLAASVAASSGAALAQTASDDQPTEPTESTQPTVDDSPRPISNAVAVEIAREYVARGTDNEVLPRFAGDETPTVAVSAVVPTEHNATTSVYLQQTIDGIPVRGAVSNVTVGSEGDVLAANESFIPVTGSFRPNASGVGPSLSVLDGVRSAADALGLVSTADFEVVDSAGDAAQSHEISDGGVSRTTIPARLVYEPVDDKTTVLAWEFLIDSRMSNDWWRIRVDAETGDELSRFNLVIHENHPSGHGAHAPSIESDEQPAASSESSFTNGGSTNPVTDGSSYRVFAAPAESPSHTAPADTQTVVNNPADANASPFGWHDTNGAAGADTTNTSGNNVDAGTDSDGDDVLDAGSQPASPTIDFDFAYNSALQPEAQAPAVVTNLFYWNNLTHDFLYSYGFNEAAGNFQLNNYGKGGLDNDAVQAEALDAAALPGNDRETNNANFATPPDGVTPRMQMYVFTGTAPERASSMDAGVITHEYAHGLSTRLTGGPAYDECLNNLEQQGEGWSDIIALLMTMQGTGPADRQRGIGTYVIGQPTTGIGIRGQAYATGGPGGANTWTYDTIKTGTFSVHRIGSVWAEMLWEMTWALVDKHGFDADLANGSGGNNIATQLIIDGLKLQPCSPGFVDSRNAILQADAINNGGANSCLIWSKFAERGLGTGADQGSSNSRLDGTEDFSVPASCDMSLAVAAPAEVAPGATVTYTLTANNGTGAPVTGGSISTTVPAGATYVANSATCAGTAVGSTVSMTVGDLAAGASTSCTYAVTAAGDRHGAFELNDRFANGLSNWRIRRGASAFSADWRLFTFTSGERSAIARPTDGVSDQYLQLAQPIAAQAGLTMSVRHGYSLEAGAGTTGYDGGVIEISVDGGASWADLGPNMVENGYERTIDPAEGSPIAGRSAFSGLSGGFKTTDIELGSYAGQNVLVRFRLASDSTETEDGFWVISSVEIINSEIRIDASPTLTSSNGTYSGFASTRVSKEPAPSSRGDVVTPITPIRLLDTRPNGATIDGTQSKQGKVPAGGSLKVPIAGRSGVPAGAAGIVINVTAIGPESTGYFTVHPCLSPVPVASSLNYTTGINLGNEIVAQVDSSGHLCIFSSATTHIAADVVGYLSSSSSYGAVAPSRLLDTRSTGGLAGGQEVGLQVGGRAGVPSNAGAVVVNVTAIGPAANGFITTHACLSPRPLSSSLNYTAGFTRGNEIVAELDASGRMCLFTSAQTNLSVDIVGYLPTGTTINSVTPSRYLDTRATGATVDGVSERIGVRSAGQVTEVVIGGRGGVPRNASSVLMNITAIRPSGTGFVTVAPCGVALPNASSLNFVGGINGGNDIIIGLGTDGKICIYNSAATELSVDVTGYAI